MATGFGILVAVVAIVNQFWFKRGPKNQTQIHVFRADAIFGSPKKNLHF